MLIQDILRKSLSQWTFECSVCGKTKPKSGPNQKCCVDCRAEHSRNYFRKYQKRRPKRGTRAVGDIVPCLMCSAPFPLKSSKHKFCAGCAKPKKVDKLAIGQMFACENCSVIVVKEFRRQSYCSECIALRERNSLPGYKAKKRASQASKYRDDKDYRARHNAQVLKFQKAKYSANPAFALNVRMRTAIGSSMNGQKRGRRWESLVGYSVVDLMRHLERQFLPGMSWSNRSEWHIDHILPLSMFKFSGSDDADFRAAWALTNLRPLWGSDNLQKWAARTHLI